ncbi:hypothetical protein BDY17DRAFT_83879 [Neohortaea acidophila]|uniref:Uncharacterized protein n=1 Tax=Neohortaea acidophila TaxID=245834 RepID=A0A6A6Q2P5_9PEZI|nr:uncharacterized protein BDY17DRAFT_83879 [Neohortaea acidophila]KAF2486670.1 hypothetical protein BDY17DRAFT_83879 [Neohortaea acidophila]
MRPRQLSTGAQQRPAAQPPSVYSRFAHEPGYACRDPWLASLRGSWGDDESPDFFPRLPSPSAYIYRSRLSAALSALSLRPLYNNYFPLSRKLVFHSSRLYSTSNSARLSDPRLSASIISSYLHHSLHHGAHYLQNACCQLPTLPRPAAKPSPPTHSNEMSVPCMHMRHATLIADAS